MIHTIILDVGIRNTVRRTIPGVTYASNEIGRLKRIVAFRIDIHPSSYRVGDGLHIKVVKTTDGVNRDEKIDFPACLLSSRRRCVATITMTNQIDRITRRSVGNVLQNPVEICPRVIR